MAFKAAAAGLAFVGAVWLSTTPAVSGCANYKDGAPQAEAPKAIICYKEKCDRTALSFVCSNTSSSSVAYDVGWSLSRPTGTAEPTISWKGQPIAQERNQHLTCYEIDAGACHFPNSVVR